MATLAAGAARDKAFDRTILTVTVGVAPGEDGYVSTRTNRPTAARWFGIRW